jgi:hypothetical protein
MCIRALFLTGESSDDISRSSYILRIHYVAIWHIGVNSRQRNAYGQRWQPLKDAL